MALPAPLDKRYGYHAARYRARALRSLYGGPLARRLVHPPASPGQLDVHLILFSGQRDALEQMASLRSFLRHAGRPARITLGSDGTHTPDTLDRLRELYEDIEVVGPDTYLSAELPAVVREYADAFASGRKLAFYVSLEQDGPILYADSDVLFFPGAAEIRDLLDDPSRTPRFLLDCEFSHDERILSQDLLEAPPVNSGFWLAHEPFDWTEPAECLEKVSGAFRFHTEQTFLHIAMHRRGAEPVDPARYVMQVEDRWDYRTRRERGPIALRHYVTGIRHQFWLNLR